jgi:hypothetical protein
MLRFALEIIVAFRGAKGDYATVVVCAALASNRSAAMESFAYGLLTSVATWCVCGYVLARVAVRRGYPPWLGFLVMIILGPLGVFVLLILPKTRDARVQDDLERQLDLESKELQRRQPCPKCGREVALSTIVCPRCEHRFTGKSDYQQA